MSKLAVLFGFGMGLAFALEPFSLQIASPVAGQGANLKSASFVFRSSGCADPSKFQVTAKAEGKVNGQRRTMALKTSAAPAPGVFGVFREWPNEGVWIVNLAATCSGRSAGALVVIGERNAINRDASKFLAHAPSEAEIEAALKSREVQ